MSNEPHGEVSGRNLLAIALASFAVLFFQIAATRVLSIVLWYHWAFLSISLAMLGLGAPGVWFALRPPSPRVLSRALLAGGLSLPMAAAAVLWIGNRYGTWSVVACMAVLLVPMLLLGTAVCILLLQARGKAIGRLYGADLLGASAAAAAVLPVLNHVPTPAAIAWLGILPVLAARLVGSRWLTVGAATAAIVAVVLHGGPLTVGLTKGYDERSIRPAHVRWTSTARLSFFDLKAVLGADLQGHGWGFGSKVPQITVPQYWMEQDGSAGTPITKFDGDVADMSEFDYLLFDVTTAGYQVRPPQRVAVVGSGGGRDLLTALRAGARDIDAVELNAGVAETVSTVFKEFSGDIYHAPGVHAVVSEGRSFLTRSRGDYDLIQISLIDSWAATAAGAFTLAENNLYTVEAFRLYLDRLSPDGLISTSRWRNGLEAGRLLLLNLEALRAVGVADPQAHLVVVAGSSVSTVLTSKRPFTADEIERARRVCEERGFELLYPAAPTPDKPADPATLLRDGPGPLEAQGVIMTASVDDQPFFFQSLPVFGSFNLEFARQFGVNGESVAALQMLMFMLTLVTLLLFFAPFAMQRWLPRQPGFWRGSGYFAVIGLSFMLIEIPWLQRFVLYLGHPSVAATVVIGALLLGAGAGSLRSARTGLATAQRLWPLVPVVLAVGNLGMSPLFAATLGAGEAVRITIAVVFLLPIGFLLGHFFPLGMQRFGDDHKAWFWALNGACGVLAGVCSLAMAMAFGFQTVAWVGVGGYLIAGLLLLRPRLAA
jgi:spermidine synthase